MSVALVLIDIQNDYFKGGKNELYNTEASVVQAKQALSLFRQKELPIIHIQHISIQADATFFLPDSDGIKIHEQVYPEKNEKVIVKHYPDSFLDTQLQDSLNELQINKLVICGMMSHMCIDTTVRTAKKLGYEVILLNDACTTKSLSWNGTLIPAKTVHQTFMASLQGTFANVIDTNALNNILF
jgi:nicotinamidase-related amidase